MKNLLITGFDVIFFFSFLRGLISFRFFSPANLKSYAWVISQVERSFASRLCFKISCQLIDLEVFLEINFFDKRLEIFFWFFRFCFACFLMSVKEINKWNFLLSLFICLNRINQILILSDAKI